MDSKGRLVLAPCFRDHLGSKVIVTRHLYYNCLMLFSQEKFNELCKPHKSNSFNELETQASNISNYYLDYSQIIEIDNANRILIKDPLRDYAKIDKECVLVGRIDYILIWNSELLSESNKRRDESVRKKDIGS